MSEEKLVTDSKVPAGEAVTAILNTKTDLEHVVEALECRGFRKSDVSVVMPVTDGRQELAFEKETKVYKGGVVGGAIGLTLGILYGWGALGGWLHLPGTEYVVERAPWMALLTTAGLGVLLGGLIGGLIGFGIPEYVTHLYEKSVRGGTMLVAIHVDNEKWKRRAIDILKFYRARDIVAKKVV